MQKKITTPDGRTLIDAEMLRAKLGGISAVTEWRRRRDDPQFPDHIKIMGRNYYDDEAANRYVLIKFGGSKDDAA